MPKKAKTLKIRHIWHIDKTIPAAGSSLGKGSHEAWRSLTNSLVMLSRVVWAKILGEAEPYKEGEEGGWGEELLPL